MREIKFRQWNPKHKKMYYDANFPFDSNKTSINRQIELSQGIGTIWMQFTGLLDKLGKEIYEGDILKVQEKSTIIDRKTHISKEEFYDEICTFEYESGCYILNHVGEKLDEGYYTHLLTVAQYPIEVIGNIYENPELLNRGN